MRFFIALLWGAIFAPVEVAAERLRIDNSELTATVLCKEGARSSDELLSLCTAALTEFRHTPTTLAVIHSEIGDAHYDLRDYPAALEAYAAALKLRPDHFEALVGTGWAHWREGKYHLAQPAFEDALDIKVTTNALAGLGSSIARGDGDVDAALPVFERALLIDPDDDWILVEAGWVHYDSGRWEKSLQAFDKALAITPRYASAHYGRAKALRKMGNEEGALSAINAAVNEAPNQTTYLSFRSGLHRDARRFARAVSDAEQAMAHDNTDQEAIVSLGRSLYDLGRTAKALEVFEDAISDDRAGVFVRYHFADVLSEEMEWSRADEVMRTAVTMPEADHYDHTLHAHILLNLNKFAAAEAASTAALRIYPNYNPAQFNQVLALALMDRPIDAYKAAEAARKNGFSDGYLSDLVEALYAEGHLLLATRIKIALSSKATD